MAIALGLRAMLLFAMLIVNYASPYLTDAKGKLIGEFVNAVSTSRDWRQPTMRRGLKSNDFDELF